MTRISAVAALVALLPAAHAAGQPPATAEGWPQWRGPDGRGRADSAVPTEWAAERNVLWRSPVPGRGHSSPIVVGERVLLTTALSGERVEGAAAVVHYMGGEEFLHPDSLGADRELEVLLLAFDRRDGSELWKRTVRIGLPHDNRHKVGSYANPTPASDGERVFAWFGTQGLHAFSLTGDPLWSRDFGAVATMGMGVGISPLPVPEAGLVVVQNDTDGGEGSFIAAVDAASGEERWRVDREQPAGWATPIPVTTAAGETRIVAMGAGAIVAYDAETGTERWRADGLRSNAVPSPVASAGGIVFAATGYPRKRILALGTEDGRLLWSYGKGQGYVPSPIFHRGLLYLVSDGGIMTALNGRTGEVVYEGGRAPVPSRFFASPVVAGERIYLTSEDGDTHVIRAGARFSVLATNSLDEPVLASPAIAGGAIYLRGAEHLYAIAEEATP